MRMKRVCATKKNAIFNALIDSNREEFWRKKIYCTVLWTKKTAVRTVTFSHAAGYVRNSKSLRTLVAVVVEETRKDRRAMDMVLLPQTLSKKYRSLILGLAASSLNFNAMVLLREDRHPSCQTGNVNPEAHQTRRATNVGQKDDDSNRDAFAELRLSLDCSNCLIKVGCDSDRHG